MVKPVASFDQRVRHLEEALRARAAPPSLAERKLVELQTLLEKLCAVHADQRTLDQAPLDMPSPLMHGHAASARHRR